MGRSSRPYASAASISRAKMLLATRKRVIQGFPLDGGLCFQLGFPAGSGGRRALGAAEPPVHKKGHVRPHRDGCNEEEQYQLYESNAHEQFSFVFVRFWGSLLSL